MANLPQLLRITRAGLNYFIGKFANMWAPSPSKNWILRRMGAKVHRDAWVSPDCLIDPLYSENVILTENAFLGWSVKVLTHELYPITLAEFNKYKEQGDTVLKGKTIWQLPKLFEDGNALIKEKNGQAYRVLKGKTIVDGFVGGDTSIEVQSEIYGKVGAHSYVRRGTIIQRGEYWWGIPAKFKKKSE